MPLVVSPRQITALQDLGARLLESRRPGTELRKLARDLLAGFFDLCVRAGQDGVLADLGVDATDWASLADHATLGPALAEQLATIDLDGGGPRNARPGQLATCLTTALGLAVEEPATPTLTLGADVRAAALAAMTRALEPELAPEPMRAAIIAHARAACEERHHIPFDRLAAQLDERGLQIVKQPKVPIDSAQVVQRLFTAARAALIDRTGRAAIAAATPVIAAASPEAAERLGQPVTRRLTPIDVAVVRATEAHVPRTPAGLAAALLDGLTEGARLAWHAPEPVVRRYAASQTFAVGDVIEHPKFGRGTVRSGLEARIQVEFADGVKTLVHAPGK